MKRLFFIITALLFFFFACTDKEKSSVEQPVVKYTETVENEKYGDCDTPGEGCAEISLAYPKFTGETVTADTLNRLVGSFVLKGIFVDEIFPDFNELAKHFVNDYKNFKREFPESSQQWYITRSVDVRYLDNSICSISTLQDEYTGGAHPNSIKNFINFDLANRNIIELKDLFKEGYQERLNSLAETRFRIARHLNPEASLEQEGFWFENNKFSVNNNFSISADSLTFYFNSYEIAPYSMGPTEFSIGLNKLKDIIKPDGVLAGYID